MSQDDYDRASELIRQHPEAADFVGPCPAKLIAQAEARLGLRFPDSYRRFLREYGAGNLAGVEIYGVIDDQFEQGGIPDAVWYTLNLREEFDLPEHLLGIHDLGDGELYFLDLSARAAEAPVLIYHPGADSQEQQSDQVAPDFGPFFLQLVELALED
jgi:hypothetical protein